MCRHYRSQYGCFSSTRIPFDNENLRMYALYTEVQCQFFEQNILILSGFEWEETL